MTAALRGRHIAILAVGGLLTIASGALAADQVLRATQPALAASVFGFDHRAKLLTLDRAAMVRRSLPPPAQARDVARKTLRVGALDPVALRFLSQADAVERKPESAVRLARLSERVTRRDLMTQVVLLEEAVGRGSIPGALVHYDRALRTNPSSQSLLFPILAGAIGDPSIRAAFAPYLASNAVWVSNFIEFAGSQQARTAATADLLVEGRADRNRGLIEVAGRPLLSRLIEAKEYLRAQRLAAIIPGAPQIGRDLNWTRATTDVQRFGVLAWVPADTPTHSASFTQADTPALSLYAAQGGANPVVSKLLALRPGRYALGQRLTVNSREGGAALSWRLTCLRATNAVVWTSADLLDRPRSVVGFAVPADCPYQRLELLAAGGSGTVGLDVTVSDFRLAAQ